jgi:ABC-type uncharacterized transport system fused permease/ATPase subunit
MAHQGGNGHDQRELLARFWRDASGLWRGPKAWRVWLICLSLLLLVIADLAVQYRLNFWTRDFFNALDARNAAQLRWQALLFGLLAVLSIAIATVSVWARMTLQRTWRRYLTGLLIDCWLTAGRFHHLNHLTRADSPQNPEYRIAEDARIATDAPVDLVLALFSSVLTTIIFFDILWSVGKDLTVEFSGMTLWIPRYLVIAVVVYSGLVTALMLIIGRRFSYVVQDQMQAEAEFRAAATRVREKGEGIVAAGVSTGEFFALRKHLLIVVEQWRRVCWQHVNTTIISHGSNLLAPVVGLILCAPKYLSGAMSLGEVTQVAAAFVILQTAFNWLVNNFQRLAEWLSSVDRVAILMLALDHANDREQSSVHAEAGPLRSQHDAAATRTADKQV